MQTKYNSVDDLRNILRERERCTDYGHSSNGDKFLKEFPEKEYSFYDKYIQFEEKMNDNWHKNVVLGAAVHGDGLLTDHGVGHVNSVISHAKDILVDAGLLTGYEIYLLLISIHFHDIGNIYGRDDHEKKIAEIIDSMGNDLYLDITEKEFIIMIATAHGGYIDGDKDTIRNVSVETRYANVVVRPRVLASILRFADEISDDFTRTEFKNVPIPVQNEIYHAYSESLSPISISKETILFEYRISYENQKEKLGKGNEKVFLYDEILKRLTKCMRELEYCRKYANGLINPTTLDIKIRFVKKDLPYKVWAKDNFRLTLHGYPSEDMFTLNHYIEQNSETDGNRRLLFLDGRDVQNRLEEEERKNA